MVSIRSHSPKDDVAGGGRAHHATRRMLLASTLYFLVAVSAFFQSYHSMGQRSVQLSTTQLQLRGQTAIDDQCRFYLAESAIPQSGLGLFTAVDLKTGDEAQSMPDICLYVADTPDGTHFETHSWARDVWHGSFEGRNPRAACEGFATLFNSMPVGIQTSKLNMLQSHDNAGLTRSEQPGAGAVSQYYGVSSKATRDVQAGSELTIDYGDWEYDPDRTYRAPVRTPDWLRKHGMCIDNIRIRTATDPAMGRGAFASRALQRGVTVAPAPLQFFSNRTVFARQAPEALFVNYCFAAGDMLLFPYGPGVNLINHSSKRPNVELKWSTHNMSHGTWLDLSLEQLHQVDYPGGMILDVVALRDIEGGEELFLDYGPSWQNAWDEHVRSWKPDVSAKGYVYPQDMDLTQPFRTTAEQEQNPYPRNLATICWTANWERDENTRMRWTKPTFDWPEGLLYCNILSRGKNAAGDFEYDVSLNFDVSRPDRRDRQVYIDTHVPHSAVQFVDKPYASDLHLKNAFRQPIALPKHLVPLHWTTTKA